MREGKNDFGMLFISRDMGVQTKAIKTTYSSCAGTWATTVATTEAKISCLRSFALGH